MKVLAADIGGTSLRAALVDDEGEILERRAGATPGDPAEGVEQLRGYWDALGPGDGCDFGIDALKAYPDLSC